MASILVQRGDGVPSRGIFHHESLLRVALHASLAARGDSHAPRTAIAHCNAAVLQVPNNVSTHHADHLIGRCIACARSTCVQEQGTIEAGVRMQARMKDEQLHVIA
jgi:hypothetical protein